MCMIVLCSCCEMVDITVGYSLGDAALTRHSAIKLGTGVSPLQ